MSNTTISNDVVSFNALTVVTGKSVTMASKVQNHVKNGANIGALLAYGIGRKAIISEIGNEGIQDTIHGLASGDIRPAVALVVAKSGKAVSVMEINGKAPYSEFLRLGATLAGMAQATKAGKPTQAAKALEIYNLLKSEATALRAGREALKSEATALRAGREALKSEATALQA